ncbi:MAG TPA: Spy/CpxP family protein refolding chaperone [Longimicrobium sp.]|jgi:hypothetical protein
MKMRIALSTLAALLVAACAGPQESVLEAGSRPGPLIGRDSLQRELVAAVRRAQMPSVFALIGARERLNLTSQQVTALDSIAEAVREQNRPLTDTLRTLTNSGGGGPIRAPRSEFQTQRFIPILNRMGDNNHRALAGVQAVLTPEQRAGVCTLAAEQREQRGRRRRDAPGRGGSTVRGGMEPLFRDSVGGGRRGRAPGGWPWCTTPRPARGDSMRTAPRP